MSTNGHDVTQADVAEAAGVSRSLVSLALSGSPKVAEGTRTRITRVAESLGYRINATASALARRHSRIIGVVLPNLRNAFFEQVSRALDDAAAALGLTIFVTVGAQDAERLQRAIDSLLGVRVLGLVLVSPWLTDSRLAELGDEIPTCVIGREPPGGQVDTVHIDEAQAAELVIAHLVSFGASSVGYIAPQGVNDASRCLREGSLARCAGRAGLRLWTEESDETGAGRAVRRLLERHGRGTGLVAHNDMLAIDAVPVLREHHSAGTRIPLVSYDNTYLARRAEFSLTSIEQPEQDIARAAVRLVVERAAARAGTSESRSAAREVVVGTSLFIRSPVPLA